ncbi:uncharacterized mitochondrial protein AtMg00310-like [Cannabis sativa]|uniref:uncharacterized mitochondrial protein AtMg00310-like n=1 Tax=Cannabis sativa TaxID=3483 RepID=UPI0011DF42BC|nr:uncharacterized mitochondrial protein AtMg00310-like [Cannabis sativa]
MGRNKTAILGFLKDKLQKRIQGWGGRLLSRAGKEVLLKTVAQAIPSYAMSVFLLLVETCKALEGIMAKFWWKTGSSTTRSISWMSWGRMCRHKHAGGLGFRSLHDFNLSLLGKQGWQLLTNESSLIGKVFKARYYPNRTFLDARLGNNPNFVWRSVHEAQSIVRAGARRMVGDGFTISILHDPWLPCPVDPYVYSDHPGSQDKTVHSLFRLDDKVWDMEIINDLFSARDRALITSIQLSSNNHSDCWS